MELFSYVRRKSGEGGGLFSDDLQIIPFNQDVWGRWSARSYDDCCAEFLSCFDDVVAIQGACDTVTLGWGGGIEKVAGTRTYI